MIRKMLNAIKRAYKMKQFKNNAVLGEKVSVSAGAFCISPSREQLQIGRNCDLLDCRLYVIGKGKISIGDYTTIRANSKLSSVSAITIGDCVIISNNVRIYDHNSHPTDPETRRKMCMGGFYGDPWSPTKAANSPVIIGDNVWIGEYSLILKGVHIGQGSIVAANSVVTKDVPDYSIVAGNPAVVVKHLEAKIKC